MNEIKKEIQKAIGDTETHKNNVWAKFQKAPHKNRKPLFVTAALLVVAAIWLLTLKLPTTDETAKPLAAEDITFDVLETRQTRPLYMQNDYAILIATNEEEYRKYTELLKLPEVQNDFNQYNVVLTHFISDGCGRIVDQLTVKNQELHIQLALPEHLRNEKELICTSIAQPNMQMLQIKKTELTSATFIIGKEPIETTFNSIEKDQFVYDFELLMDPDSIQSITVTELINGQKIDITDTQVMQQIVSIFYSAEQQPGILELIEPNLEMIVRKIDGDMLKIFVWLSSDSEKVYVMSANNTNSTYTIPMEQGMQILQLAGLEME